jgi:hypothetical protein
MKFIAHNKLFILYAFFLAISFPQVVNANSHNQYTEFEAALARKQQLLFSDSGTDKWQKNWFLDGLRAEVKNTSLGMYFVSGPIRWDHGSHAVLWTHKSFQGDICIEYDYTRMDTIEYAVNILYLHATGIGVEPFSKDIKAWSHLREIPYMSLYFRNMNLLHISYAAFYTEDTDNLTDYIRARRYPVKKGEKFGQYTLIEPTFKHTGFFKPGVQYHITVVKSGDALFMKVEGDGKKGLYRWDTSGFPDVNNGRIGLRQMWTRAARYANFKVYSLANEKP